jgi:hypothetical protein
MSLAAIRWFANALENDAVELYATNRESYQRIEAVLREALHGLVMVREEFQITAEENGCPDGYVICNGVCAPSCEGLADSSNNNAAFSKAPNSK